MTIVDYTRSYIFFTTKGRTNTARLMVEARCELLDGAGAAAEEFFFLASCKSEDTYVERGLFKNPNYDFCGVFSEREFALIRTPASYEGERNSVGPIQGYFEDARLMIRWDEEAELLDSTEAIVRATLEGRPLVGRTEVAAGEGARVLFEYPIKTMNVNAATQRFQVDTGPIPFPDLSAPGRRAIEQMKLAFVAYNRLDAAEFILQQPTPILRDGREVCRVLHYSDIRELPATNAILAVG